MTHEQHAAANYAERDRADAALYRAKQAGRDQVAVATIEPLAIAAE